MLEHDGKFAIIFQLITRSVLTVLNFDSLIVSKGPPYFTARSGADRARFLPLC